MSRFQLAKMLKVICKLQTMSRTKKALGQIIDSLLIHCSLSMCNFALNGIFVEFLLFANAKLLSLYNPFEQTDVTGNCFC